MLCDLFISVAKPPSPQMCNRIFSLTLRMKSIAADKTNKLADGTNNSTFNFIDTHSVCVCVCLSRAASSSYIELANIPRVLILIGIGLAFYSLPRFSNDRKINRKTRTSRVWESETSLLNDTYSPHIPHTHRYADTAAAISLFRCLLAQTLFCPSLLEQRAMMTW